MTVTPDIPTSLDLNPGATTLALLDHPVGTLALRAGATTLALGPGATTLALYDLTTTTPLDPRTTTLLLDG